MRRTTLVTLALACAAMTLLVLTAEPAEAGTCYIQCEINYFDCLASGGTHCSQTYDLCVLQCGGSTGGGGGGGTTGRNRTPYDNCINDCRFDFFDCIVNGPPPGSSGTCEELQDQCENQCAAIWL